MYTVHSRGRQLRHDRESHKKECITHCPPLCDVLISNYHAGNHGNGDRDGNAFATGKVVIATGISETILK